MSKVAIPHLLSVHDWGVDPSKGYPFDLPWAKGLALDFTTRVTFFVGENGSGKSTLLEALADLCGLPVSGGGKNELGQRHGPEERSPFRGALRGGFRRRPWDGFFLRAEFYAHFASLLEQRDAEREFGGDPYFLYGGRSLHTRSHGEAFMEIIQGRMDSGMFLLDEPESALSPQRQLALLGFIHAAERSGEAQFIIATHSPILLSYPGARIISFDEPGLPEVRLEETSHCQITRGLLEAPERYFRHLWGENET